MDLGATVCTRTRPRCDACPVRASCTAFKNGQIDLLPAPRPRKALPEKHAQLLVIRHGADVLLEKRPAPGIWGGLWSLPQIEMQTAAASICLSLTGSPATHIQALPAFTHTFTHFRLHIQPQEVLLSGRSKLEKASGKIWMSIEDAVHAAVPKPVSRILSRLAPA
jgi:A/G-specific adenine glycosylase